MQNLERGKMPLLWCALAAMALLSGCMTPLSLEEKTHIHRISISSQLGHELVYMKSGMTIFELKFQKISDEGILSNVVSKTSEMLRNKGYEVVSEGEPCDYVLLIKPEDFHYGSGIGWNIRVNGPHFLTSRIIGIPLPIRVMSMMSYELRSPNSAKVRIRTLAARNQSTGLKKSEYWEELTKEDKEMLLGTMKSELMTVPEEALKGLGF